MRHSKTSFWIAAIGMLLCLHVSLAAGGQRESLVEGEANATMVTTNQGSLRTYELTTTAELRDHHPPDRRVVITEVPGHATIRTGSILFDGLYALAVQEALQNSVGEIKDAAYNNGAPMKLEAFQTGAFWTYVWTRDLSYSVHLALAQFDPARALNSLYFKTSELKPSVLGGFTNQIVQDTGSGGSYPVSSDRIAWSLGASAALKFLPAAERQNDLSKVYAILRDTLEQDRRLIFDARDGLYRGEESFLDWREQTYPGWTKDNVLAIAQSKALSVNVADYFALQTAAEYAGRLGLAVDQTHYVRWAAELKQAINQNFYDPQAGLYSAYRLTDVDIGVPVHRYDLLGESLAILLGVADERQATAIIEHYPVGPFGPPVVWPQELTVPIYHNHSLWPFVTSYWIKAARQANNAKAVNAGVRSLVRGAALNLSNMENADFATGKAQVAGGKLNGPVINSQRQIWSVAGYLAMVQDVVFGLETTWDGIRFRPFVTDEMCRGQLAATNVLELRHFNYRGKLIDLRVHLPVATLTKDGACQIKKIVLNGKPIGSEFVSMESLRPQNEWDVYLENGTDNSGGKLREIADVTDERTVFGPLPAVWDAGGQGGVALENGLLTLHYRHEHPAEVMFNIYRDGKLQAQAIRQLQWTDAQSGDYSNTMHFYAIEAVDVKSGNASHLTPTRFFTTENQQWIILAKTMVNRGGQLANDGYFMNWGNSGDELVVTNFTAIRSGKYLLRAKFSNGAGPVNTGITCAVKKLEVRKLGSEQPVAGGYLVMPQSGDWQQFDLSSVVRVELQAGQSYSIRICEDEISRNMSYLRHNQNYTGNSGGGALPYNYVNIAALHLLRIAD